MEFVLMKLEFPEEGEPTFAELAFFKTTGVVMNVFLLDPSSRLLSAFVWVSGSNTIGLYALLDWEKEEYVFIDTGIQCVRIEFLLVACSDLSLQSMSSNWSCILYQEQIVIHSEESNIAHQYFYPISLLQKYARPSSQASTFIPNMSEQLSPITRMSAPFIFPPQTRPHSPESILDVYGDEFNDGDVNDIEDFAAEGDPTNDVDDDGSGTVSDSNPFPYPPWYPESAHFVRQWWPTLASVPRLSCTVVLLADHAPDTHRTRYVLAQHYFKVPLIELEDLPAAAAKDIADMHATANGFATPVENRIVCSPTVSSSSSSSSSSSTTTSDFDAWNVPVPPEPSSPTPSRPARTIESPMMRLWYVSEPFEVVCVLDGPEDESDTDAMQERPRPLMAVDFGHAVWIEFTYPPEMDRDEKRLRFVSFPPVTTDRDEMAYGPGRARAAAAASLEGVVHTLDIPDELDLDTVETINIDQSQGAIIISVRDGKIFILCYE